MKTSVAALVLALSGSALAAPFKYNGTSIANSTYVYPAASGRPTPSHLSTKPLSSPFTSSTSLPLPTSTPFYGSEPASIIPAKRGEDLSIPTDLPSLVSDAQSVAAAVASAGAQKRAEDLSIPTDLPSLISDAQSVAAALASGGAQKRGLSSSVSTGTPVTPTATPSSTPVTSTGTPSATAAPSIPFTPSSSKPLSTSTGFSLFGFPLA